MPRYDKVDSTIGVFRGTLLADVVQGDYNKILGCGLNASGLVTPKLPSVSGFKGVAVLDKTNRKAGNRIDVMTAGEIVFSSDETNTLVAGTTYYLDANGALSTTESRYMVGHTVEAWRLVVRFSDQGAA